MSRELFHALHLVCKKLHKRGIRFGDEMGMFLIMFQFGWESRERWKNEGL